MGKLIFVVGKTGSGKSYSMRNLDPKSTIIVNSDKKPFSDTTLVKNFTKENQNCVVSNKLEKTMDILEAVHTQLLNVNVVIIDTWSRIMVDAVNAKDFRATGGKNYLKKWGEMAQDNYDMLDYVNNELRDDVHVYLMCHPEFYHDTYDEVEKQRAVVQGQALKKMAPESFSSIVLYADILREAVGVDFVFRTITNGLDTCKTPPNMFNGETIPNDLKEVDIAIRKYYQ